MLGKIRSIFGKEEKKEKESRTEKKKGKGKSKKPEEQKKSRGSARKDSSSHKGDAGKAAKEKKERADEHTSEEREWPNKIKAIAIVELMGAPEDHIKNTMQLYLERIKEHKMMAVEDEFVSEMEKKDTFFLQFAELTITFKSAKNLIEFCFDYMPSSIEIIEPEKIIYNSQDLSNIINDLQAKLHQLDMIVKNLRAENNVLNENGNLLLRNLILVSLKKDARGLDELSKITGINPEALENYLSDYVAKGLLSEKDGVYKATKGNTVE